MVLGALSGLADHAGRGASPAANIVAVIRQRFEGKEERRMKMKTLAMVYLTAAALLLSGCVSQQKYNALDQEYQQLQQSMTSEVGAQKMQITRLQNAIKVSVNGELLFPSGGWQMPAQAQQTIAKMAVILAPQQTTKINVNGYTDNTPIGPGLMSQGVTSNLILSQKRADNVMQYMISQGVNPNLVSAQGFGDADPVASNATPEGKAQNRRVELTLANSGSQ
jgi:chemotaxis protein MotB